MIGLSGVLSPTQKHQKYEIALVHLPHKITKFINYEYTTRPS